jgi:hypothetical protein
MNVQEAIQTFRRHQAEGVFDAVGIGWEPGAEPIGYWPDGDRKMALDAVSTIPTLTTTANSSIPALLTTFIDPKIYEVLFAPNYAAEIMGEERKGTWVDQTYMLPVAEATGETSSYGDRNQNGRAGVNVNFPQVQSYLFQVIKTYGELELARMGLARINWVNEIDRATAITLNKFANFCYFFGVQGIQNYGLLNNPFLTASLTPGAKAAGGTAWINASGVVVATANEVFTDIQSMFYQLQLQNAGLVDAAMPMKLCLGPTSAVALTATNSFNVNVHDLLKKNFPKLVVMDKGVQYQAKSTSNPQGIAGGNLVQLIVDEVEGQKTGFAAYNEKQRAFPIIRLLSAFEQKVIAGTFGTVLRYPAGISSMLGI